MMLFKQRAHRRAYTMTVGILFTLVGALHLIRAAMGWDLIIGSVMIPTGISWLAGAVLIFLAYKSFTRKL